MPFIARPVNVLPCKSSTTAPSSTTNRPVPASTAWSPVDSEGIRSVQPARTTSVVTADSGVAASSSAAPSRTSTNPASASAAACAVPDPVNTRPPASTSYNSRSMRMLAPSASATVVVPTNPADPPSDEADASAHVPSTSRRNGRSPAESRFPKKTDDPASTSNDDDASCTGRARCSVPSGHARSGPGARRNVPFVTAASGTSPAPNASAVSSDSIADCTGIVASAASAPDAEQRKTFVAPTVPSPSTVSVVNVPSCRVASMILPPPSTATDAQLESPPTKKDVPERVSVPGTVSVNARERPTPPRTANDRFVPLHTSESMTLNRSVPDTSASAVRFAVTEATSAVTHTLPVHERTFSTTGKPRVGSP